MARPELIRSAENLVDAEVLLEWKRSAGLDTIDQIRRWQEARFRTERLLADSFPEDSTLQQALCDYLTTAASLDVDAVDDAQREAHATARHELLQQISDEKRAAPESADESWTIPIPLTTRILIAIDGSSVSDWAIEAGSALAEAVGAHVQVLHVVAEAEPDRSAIARGRTVLEQSLRKMSAPVDAEQALRHGEPSAEIIDAAQQWEADLIVMGTRGRGRLAEFVLGSTAEAVIRGSACPVFTVSQRPERFIGKKRKPLSVVQ